MHPRRAPWALRSVPSSRWSSDAGLHPTSSDVVVDDDAHGLYLIARGLGPTPLRTQAANAAASAAVSLARRSIALDPRTPLGVMARLALGDANAVVWRMRAPDEAAPLQVVLTLLLVRNGEVAVGHVGHGRVLEVVGERVTRLTAEHTVPGDHAQWGYPAPSAGASAPVELTRYLGQRMFVEADLVERALPAEATYLLLGPGFGEPRLDEALARTTVLRAPRVPAKLIELARSAGEPGRLSALAVRASAPARPVSESRSSLGHRVWSSLQTAMGRRSPRSA